jgi:hypothetical protein
LQTRGLQMFLEEQHTKQKKRMSDSLLQFFLKK